MSKARQIHYDAIALAVDALGSVRGSEDETARRAHKRLKRAALATIAVTREVAAAARDANLLAECDRAQKEVEGHETPDG